MLNSRPQQPRRAFSLLEFLLVLALLVAVAALAVPALETSLKGQRLVAGAEQVRSQMSTARVRAMKSSQIHAMYVEPGGPRLRIEPWMTAEAPVDTPTANSSVGSLSAGSGASDVLLVDEPLPEGVIFYSAVPLTDNRSLVTQEQQSSSGGAMGAGAGTPPILFYPDGTTSTAQVTVTDAEGAFIVVSLRGLTGIASVSSVLSEQELATP